VFLDSLRGLAFSPCCCAALSRPVMRMQLRVVLSAKTAVKVGDLLSISVTHGDASRSAIGVQSEGRDCHASVGKGQDRAWWSALTNVGRTSLAALDALAGWWRDRVARTAPDPYDGLSREALAAAMLQWQGQRAYRVTQPANRVRALRTWRQAMRVYRNQRHGEWG